MVRRLILLLAMLGIAPSAPAEVELLVSIRPLQLIAAAIVGDGDRIGVLIPPDQSPHHYNLRPSDRRALDSAQLIIWVGPQLETFLTGTLEQLAADQSLLQISALPDIRLLPLRTTLHAGAESRQPDLHVWLSPANAAIIATELAARLISMAPQREAEFRRNLAGFSAAVMDLDGRLARQFSAVQNTAYIVYHDAYQYLEQRYGLQPLLVLVPDTEIQPGMRHIMDTRRRIAETRPQCLFVDPVHNPAMVATMLNGYQVTQRELDILGADQTADALGYVAMLDRLSATMVQCLAGTEG